MLPIADIRARLGASPSAPQPNATAATVRQAAVAVVLREWREDTEVLFIIT